MKHIPLPIRDRDIHILLVEQPEGRLGWHTHVYGFDDRIICISGPCQPNNPEDQKSNIKPWLDEILSDLASDKRRIFICLPASTHELVRISADECEVRVIPKITHLDLLFKPLSEL